MCIPFANLPNYVDPTFLMEELCSDVPSSCRDRPVVGAPRPLRRLWPPAPAIPRQVCDDIMPRILTTLLDLRLLGRVLLGVSRLSSVLSNMLRFYVVLAGFAVRRDARPPRLLDAHIYVHPQRLLAAALLVPAHDRGGLLRLLLRARGLRCTSWLGLFAEVGGGDL